MQLQPGVLRPHFLHTRAHPAHNQVLLGHSQWPAAKRRVPQLQAEGAGVVGTCRAQGTVTQAAGTSCRDAAATAPAWAHLFHLAVEGVDVKQEDDPPCVGNDPLCLLLRGGWRCAVVCTRGCSSSSERRVRPCVLSHTKVLQGALVVHNWVSQMGCCVNRALPSIQPPAAAGSSGDHHPAATAAPPLLFLNNCLSSAIG